MAAAYDLFSLLRNDTSPRHRILKGAYDFSFHKVDNYTAMQESASNPWPHLKDGSDNLCAINRARPLKAVIVMGADRKYVERVQRCYPKNAPFEANAEYADKHGYALRLYVDDDNPFLLRHSQNALQGELRKIFSLADAARPGGPRFGEWRTKAHFSEPDLVMWVDSDAHLNKGHPIPNHPGSVDPRASITLSEVLTRSCKRAEFPEDYVRVLGQDSGGNVNAGWYLISAKAFGMHFLRYVLELFEIYGPTGVWGQNVIQEALLVVMRGEPPHLWSYSIPCSGEKLGVLPRRVLAEFEGQCAAEGGSGGGEGGEAHGGGAGSSHGGPGSAAFRECVVGKASKHVEAKFPDHLTKATAINNGCFSQQKLNFAPNSQGNWDRAMAATKNQVPGKTCGTQNLPACCSGGYNSFASPGCNGGKKYWSASGAGIVLLQIGDQDVRFNQMRIPTALLWHHGSASGQFVRRDCL